MRRGCRAGCSSASRGRDPGRPGGGRPLGYIARMFEVLAFVYENYGRGASFPEPRQLGRKLSAHGFDDEEIGEALHWLDGLSLAAQGLRPEDAELSASVPWEGSESAAAGLAQSGDALRVYCAAEQERLGAEGLGFIHFLEIADALPMRLREIVMDRAMAIPDEPVALEELKIIVLMVYWRTGTRPDALVLDELCRGTPDRIAH
ncbi:MAG: hypothetical protein JWQ03_1901 [Variovorax sp.]|nr:hypothetical protein [Variovorax sp.]